MHDDVLDIPSDLDIANYAIEVGTVLKRGNVLDRISARVAIFVEYESYLNCMHSWSMP